MSQINPLIPYAGTNLGLAAVYYLIGRHRILAPQGFYKHVGAVALVPIIHIGYRFLEKNGAAEDQNTVLPFMVDLASLGVLVGGAHLAGMTKKATLVSTAFFTIAQTAITTYFLFPERHVGFKDIYKHLCESYRYASPPLQPPASTPLDEARQVQGAMKEGSFKEKARALIALSELRLSPEKRKTYFAQVSDLPDNTHAEITYLCGAAVILKDESILEEAFQRAKAIDQVKHSKEEDKHLKRSKSACMIAIMRAHQELNPSIDTSRYRAECTRTIEVDYWIKDATPSFSRAGASVNSENPVSQFEDFLQKGQLDKARAETRKDVFNLYWRVEALCRVAEAEG